jgi:transposase
MDLIAKLTHSSLDPALLAQVLSALNTSATATAVAAQQAQVLDATTHELKNAKLLIQALKLELAQHKRLRFGVKTEALNAEQRVLFEETWSSDLAELEQRVDALEPKPRTPRAKAGRQPLPENLPRIDYRHEPASCTCERCGEALSLLREEVTEQLDVEPARFFVRRHIRPQYSCRTCETVSAAPAPASIIEGGLAAPGLLGWVMVSKFQDHLPLYRIEQIAARGGVTLARSTLADWVGRTGFALHPLADRLAELLRQRQVIHADETPVQQLDPGKGKTKRAYLWAYRSNDLDEGPPLAVFNYCGGRSGEHARVFLDGWRGDLVVDDYGGYKELFHVGVREIGCWAHARRKFFELYSATKNATAGEALQRIAELYGIEAQGRDLTCEERQQQRQQSQTLLSEFKQWLEDTRIKIADGGALAKAIDYSLRRWPALSRYAYTGNLPLDNNPVENIIRPIAIGKKNWMFTGSERAGQRAAAIQSLLATAKLNGIEPLAWLTDTLEKLPTWPNSRLDDLLPIKH